MHMNVEVLQILLEVHLHALFIDTCQTLRFWALASPIQFELIIIPNKSFI